MVQRDSPGGSMCRHALFEPTLQWVHWHTATSLATCATNNNNSITMNTQRHTTVSCRNGHTWTWLYCAYALAFTCCKRKPSRVCGPTSNVCGKCAPRRRPYNVCIVCSQRTGLHSWLTSWCLMLFAVRYCRDVTLLWTGMIGSCRSVAAMARVTADTVECISLEWNAPDTGRSSMRLIPNSCRFLLINSNAYNNQYNQKHDMCFAALRHVKHSCITQ